ncbi:M56 family metallopeptidase [Psychroserpens ponticola]|uniref:M56 family metallopeptidase n=1 Tax=Psychroserpens ponticola TaxID=2932268 RepID=A0ABY7S0D1_9FLAO|nr:M56 family metallopeptidase [Psychroserpens ponticola]WCO02462.1 M56 family metallopeptidase [Psychroserpens ponticola]
MDYLLKSSAILFIFYACYKLFLQRDTFFESNRWFLLIGIIIASIIPSIIIPIYIEYTPVSISEFTISNTSEITSPIINEQFNYLQLIVWIYVIGLLFFIGKLIIELLSLKRILKKGSKQSFGKFKLIETNKEIAPFSFFNYIVYNPNQLNDTELQHVINHEKAHSQQLHSIDTIIAQIASVILWFNPFIWLYKSALQQNLEFIADKKAQHISNCKKSYQTVLLKASIKNHQLVFTNNFYTSLIKKRIIMLHKSKSKKLNQLKLFMVLPLLAIFIMSFNTENIYIETTTNESEDTNQVEDSEKNIEIIITKNTSKEDLKSIKEKLKSNGILFNYNNVKRNSEGEITSINTKFKNDKNSSNYNISGEEGIKSFHFKSSKDTFSVGTIDKKTFVYETKDGNVKLKSAKKPGKIIVIEEDNNGTSTVDVRVLKNNDSVYFTKYNKFTFSTDDKNSNVFISESEDPIFFINGKQVEKSLFEDVDSDDIKSVFILKGENAIEKYGAEGKNGVIVMTKKGTKNLLSEDKDNIIFNSKNVFKYETDREEPIYILNGKLIDKNHISEISPNDIDKVEVLKDESAIKLYGKEAKNGVIIINTKIGRPVEVKTEITHVTSEDDNGEVNVEFFISKNSTDAHLSKQKNDFKAHGIDAKFTKIKRNKAGEITSIKISLDDNNGRKSSASWKEKSQAIPDIIMGITKSSTLFIKAIEN